LFTDVSGQRDGPIFNGQEVQEEKDLNFLTLDVGQIRCPETSVNNYHTALRNAPEERKSHQHAAEA
jgi:hypothetical protein